MKEIIPQNGHVLCRMVEGKTKQTIGFISEVESVPIFEILKLSGSSTTGVEDNMLKLNVGDKIICNSSGTLVQDAEDDALYLFKLENIMAKVIE